MDGQIKFRAWDGKSMRYGGFSVHATNGVIEPLAGLSTVTPYSPLMQFTGLHDKNGVEIYESDIVFADGNDSMYEVKNGGYELSSYYDLYPHECTGFYLSRITYTTGIEPIGGDCSMLKVVGNIYENPELLK